MQPQTGSRAAEVPCLAYATSGSPGPGVITDSGRRIVIASSCVICIYIYVQLMYIYIYIYAQYIICNMYLYIRAGCEVDKRNARSHTRRSHLVMRLMIALALRRPVAGPDIRFKFRGLLFSTTGSRAMGNVCRYLNDVYEDYEATYSRRHHEHSSQPRLKYIIFVMIIKCKH